MVLHAAEQLAVYHPAMDLLGALLCSICTLHMLGGRQDSAQSKAGGAGDCKPMAPPSQSLRVRIGVPLVENNGITLSSLLLIIT
jgi:hypothetical protein